MEPETPKRASSARRAPIGRYLPLTVVTVAGLFLSFYMFHAVGLREKQLLQAEFERRAVRAVTVLQEGIVRQMEPLASIAGLYAASREVERSEFRAFARAALARHPEIQALEWIPRVRNADRPAYEAAARREGFRRFFFSERKAQGEMARAAVRDEYFPVYFLEPLEGNEPAAGYDLGSSPERRAALEKARDSGEMVATSPILLVQERAAEPGLVVFQPIYRNDAPRRTREDRRRNLIGFGLGVFRVRDMLDPLFREMGADGIESLIRDRMAPPGLSFLHRHREESPGYEAPPGEEKIARIRSGVHMDAEVEFPGRRWSVLLSPSGTFLARHASFQRWDMLGGGLLVTGLLCALHLVWVRRSDRIERMAEEIARSNEELQREIEVRKIREEQLRQSEERLRQSQKMEAVGRLAGGIAHDFNNLLLVINGYASLLLAHFRGEDPRKKEAEEILAAGERAAGLTRQLLAFGRRQVLQPKVLDLNALFSAMAGMLRRLIGEHIELATQFSEELWPVKADPGQLERILANLAVNARDAMPRGGRLTIRTSNLVMDAGREREHPSAVPGGHVLIEVSDTGMGMDEETRSHIFEPFYTTKETGKGTGLGMATVYGIVNQSHGHIEVDSEVGRGTTVRIFFPRVEKAREREETEAKGEPPSPGRETVLLVEDEPAVQTLVREILTGRGYRVLEADQGEEALRRIERHDGPVDLLITDVVMPRMGGPDLWERISAMRPGMKALFISGYARDALEHRKIGGPGCAFLQKPFAPDILAKKVREVLDSAPGSRG